MENIWYRLKKKEIPTFRKGWGTFTKPYSIYSSPKIILRSSVSKSNRVAIKHSSSVILLLSQIILSSRTSYHSKITLGFFRKVLISIENLFKIILNLKLFNIFIIFIKWYQKYQLLFSGIDTLFPSASQSSENKEIHLGLSKYQLIDFGLPKHKDHYRTLTLPDKQIVCPSQ